MKKWIALALYAIGTGFMVIARHVDKGTADGLTEGVYGVKPS